MATSNALTCVSLEAEAAIATQFSVVKPGTAGKSVVAAGAGEAGIGIIQNKPAANEGATIAISGVSKAVAGAVIAVNAEVTADANGKLVTATTGDYVIGTALVAAGAANELIPVLLRTPYISL